VAVAQLTLSSHVLLAVATAGHVCIVYAAARNNLAEWTTWQVLSLGKHYALTLALSTLQPQGGYMLPLPLSVFLQRGWLGPYMLVAGLTDCKLHVFVSNTALALPPAPFQFERVDVLSGHDDWIRALASVQLANGGMMSLRRPPSACSIASLSLQQLWWQVVLRTLSSVCGSLSPHRTVKALRKVAQFGSVHACFPLCGVMVYTC
jgi:hypothetical protein